MRYLLFATALLSIVVGCASTSDRDDQSNRNFSTKSDGVAVYPTKIAAAAAFLPQAEGLPVLVLRDRYKQGRRAAILLDSWRYCFPDTSEVIEVEPGFLTDFASVPSIARFFLPSFGRHAEATVAHDWLYAVGGTEKDREKADKILLRAMEEQKVNWLQRSIMYRAVRLFGGNGFALRDDWLFVDPISLEEFDVDRITPDEAYLYQSGCQNDFGSY